MQNELIRPPSLVEVVANHVRESIFAGELEPGQQLREIPLSEALGVSRNTVREAQRVLRDEGLVRVVPHRGVFVVDLSPRTVEEVYSLRIILESYGVRLALENKRYGKQEMENLQALLGMMKESEAVADGPTTAMIDVRFHYAICEPSDHRLLLETLRRLQSRARFLVTYVVLQGLDPGPLYPQHKEILDAIRDGVPEPAAELVRAHLAVAQSMLLTSDGFVSGR
jgi:DNA-binding GntR family transcriptional regulator